MSIIDLAASFSAEEMAILLGALVVAAAALLVLSLISHRESTLQDRIRTLQELRSQPEPDLEDAGAVAMPEEPSLYRRLGELVASSPLVEKEKAIAALSAAGLYRRGTLALFAAAKLLSFGGSLGSVWVAHGGYGLLAGKTVLVIGLFVGAALFGWRAPDLVLARIGARRRAIIERGMPDALDLLVICAEAGLSLEQALDRLSRDLRAAHPVLAEEIATTVAEMRVLPDRRLALENLARRVGVPSVRGVVATLSQTLKYGTPLAQSLRVLATEMRNARMLRFEERAARLPVLLTLPLIGFILPCLFIIVAGPAALGVMDLMNR